MGDLETARKAIRKIQQYETPIIDKDELLKRKDELLKRAKKNKRLTKQNLWDLHALADPGALVTGPIGDNGGSARVRADVSGILQTASVNICHKVG